MAELGGGFLHHLFSVSEEMRRVWQRAKGLSQVGKLPEQCLASSLMLANVFVLHRDCTFSWCMLCTTVR